MRAFYCDRCHTPHTGKASEGEKHIDNLVVVTVGILVNGNVVDADMCVDCWRDMNQVWTGHEPMHPDRLHDVCECGHWRGGHKYAGAKCLVGNSCKCSEFRGAET